MSIKSIIIDDEPDARENLSLFLKEFCNDVNICGEANSIQTGLALIKKELPNIVFLDIQLGAQTVFELLHQIENIDFQIIFVTAHDHFALKAIEFSAIDYLLKPIEIPKLKRAVEKAKDQIVGNKLDQRLNNLLYNLNPKNNIHKIALITSEGFELIYIDTIMYCLADGSYTHFHFTNRNPIVVSKNLKHYQRILSDCDFIRCHNSNLINLIFVKTISKSKGGYIKMEDDTILPITKSSRIKLESRIKMGNHLI